MRSTQTVATPKMIEQIPYNERPCLKCGKPYKKGSSSWWGYCPDCGVVQQFYEALPMQAAFHASPAKYRLYIGGFGSGKTLCGCQEAVQLALEYDHNYIMVGAMTYPNLRDTTRKQLLEIVPEPYLRGGSFSTSFSSTENELTFANGSVIIFRSMDDPNKYKSLNLGAFYLDELSEATQEMWQMLEGRLRLTTVPRRTGFATSNPEGHNWVWKYFINAKKKNYEVFVAPTTENVYLPDDYVSGLLESYDEAWVRRYIYADFNTFEGKIYTDFQPEAPYVVPYTKPPEGWPIYVGIDHGLQNPTAVLWAAVDPETGRVYIFQEYYKRGALVEDHVKMIKYLSNGYPIYSYFIDPSTKMRNSVTGKSVMNEYIRLGLPVRPANNDVLAGIERVSSYFKLHDGLPSLQIADTCTNLIEELSEYKWETSQTNKNHPEKPHKFHDHAADALRYIIMGLPSLARVKAVSMVDLVPRPLEGFGSPDADQDTGLYSYWS